MDGIAWTDGKVVPLATATVPLMDRGYLLGDGIFETMRVAGGQPFRLDAHLARLEHGLQALGLDAEIVADVRAAIDGLVSSGRKKMGDELYLRINVTTGTMVDIAGADGGVQVTGFCRPFQPYPMSHYARGVAVVNAPVRVRTDNPLAGVKSMSFLPYVQARRHAMSKTVHDGILLNEHERVAEASTSNVFVVADGQLYAPGRAEGALPGVTRQVVLELADDIGMDIHKQLTLADVATASEAFLTNTTGGVVPLTKWSGKPVGDGSKGEYATKFGQSLEALIRGRK